ncbi:MAG: NTP/NDP exchange transporter [Alphaproteobacteria bacterium]|nr:MAG: NTP/NDP exchange transporter [Alphaproteobacteria bacterium]
MRDLQQVFSRIRQFLWPIRRHELIKFLPMAGMMFCILFNYTVLRNTKDSLVISSMGTSVIPFIKGFVVLPVSMLFVVLYSKLCNTLSRGALFHTFTGVFIVFFFLYSTYLYPNRNLVQPDAATIDALKLAYPHLQHVWSLYENWTYTAFYVFAELWGSVSLGLLFWQFANEVTHIEEAKRFYAMFAFLGHFALIIGGYAVQAQVGADCDAHFTFIFTAVIFFALAANALYWFLNHFVVHERVYADSVVVVKKRPKLSVRQSLKEIMRSKYLGLIGVLVFSYNFSMNLIGLVWKTQLKLQFPDVLALNNFMGQYQSVVGLVTVLTIPFVKSIVERMSWYVAAIMTPLVLLGTGILFFFFVFQGHLVADMIDDFGLTPVYVAVIIGAIQQLLSKSCKYALFDPTKEMAYIPLDDELKSKGKAAVDVFGMSFSKAFAGYLTGIMLAIFAITDLMIIAPFMAIMIIGSIFIWMWAVKRLSILYKKIIDRDHAA